MAAALAASVALLAMASGCSSDGPDSSDASEVGARRSTTTPTGDSESTSGSIQMVAQSTGQVEVWATPENEATSQMLSAATEPSGTLTFVVLETLDDGWLRVQLPEPPPGGTGYVREADVSLSRHRYQIVVSRGAHTLKVLAGGVEAIAEPVAIGPDAPSAGSSTFIKELLIPPDGTPYGGHVYGLAGWSSSEQEFGAGAGVVAIHAAAPAALGTDTLTGAIGTDAQVLTQLVDNVGLPLGTPVLVTD
jgi:hypothetical protein